MEKIYLLKNDKIMLGPYTIEKIREKNLKPSDLVWYEGLADWTPAGNLIQLKDGGQTIPAENTKGTIKTFLKKLFALGR